MKEIVVIGLGPGTIDDLSLGAWNTLLNSEKIFLRTYKHPVVQDLAAKNIRFTTFDYLYEEKETFNEVYETIVQKLINELLENEHLNQLVYAVPGNPLVGEESVRLLLQAGRIQNIKITVRPAMSFLDSVYVLLELDPGEGLLILDALSVQEKDLKICDHVLFLQVYSKLVASDLKLTLLESYPVDHPVVIIRAAGIAGEESLLRVPLSEMDHFDSFDHLTSIYLEPYKHEMEAAKGSLYPLDPLVEIMEKLLSPQGCPWDRKQDHYSLKPYLLEEAYEVIEAIDSKDMNKLLEELGDLLLQVIFHATLAQKRGDFTNNDVIRVISEKLVRRHPHVFSNVIVRNADDVIRNWEQIKAEERGAKESSNVVPNRVMQRINRSLPALLLAEDVQKRAGKVGFDWENSQGAWDKLFEEIDELKSSNKDKLETENELGDLLFAVVNLARFLEVSPEVALIKSVNKFVRRFNYIEDQVINDGKMWEEFNLAQLDNLWKEAKKIGL